MRITRRDFIKKGLFIFPSLLTILGAEDNKEEKLKEAMFYDKLSKDRIRCNVCFRKCLLSEGERSFCRNKVNISGKLYSLVYGRPSAVHIDPIEKEPAYHMLPGTEILCFGTAGCNFRCKFCQNWHLSQRSIEDMFTVLDLTPADGIYYAQERKIPTLSFTYNEPTSFYEYLYDIAKLAKAKGFKVLIHSNGAMNPEPLQELLKYTDAVTIDLKGFSEEFYSQVSGASLAPVLKTLKTIRENNKWLEIVNLIVPTLNDDKKDISEMVKWINDNLGDYTPLHFSRFFPQYKLKNLPPTPIKTLEDAYGIAKTEGLKFVSIGNVPGHKYNSTFCPNCNTRLIHRIHFNVLENKIKDGKCPKCKTEIPGLWA